MKIKSLPEKITRVVSIIVAFLSFNIAKNINAQVMYGPRPGIVPQRIITPNPSSIDIFVNFIRESPLLIKVILILIFILSISGAYTIIQFVVRTIRRK